MKELAYGVRELQAKIGEVLRAVGRGDRVIVTSRGKPVAAIIPVNVKIPGESALDRKRRRLAAEGKLILRKPGRLRPFKAFSGRGVSDQILADRR